MKHILFLLSFLLCTQALRADDVQGIFYNPSLGQYLGNTRANGMVGFRQGNTTGLSACQGCVGEIISSFGTTTSTNGSYTNNATISVPPGNWSMSLLCGFGAASGLTLVQAGISNVSASGTPLTTGVNYAFAQALSTAGATVAVPAYHVILTTTTNEYAVVSSQGGTPNVSCTIAAQRIF